MGTTAKYEPFMGDMDIIFAGGGTAACVAAGRLAAADLDLKILLIEGGPDNYHDPTVVNPAAFLTHLKPDSNTAIFYKSKPSEYLDGREAIVPMGGILGGGSSINFMMYTRAQGVDFDSWKTPGWTAADMLPLCKKLETFHQNEEGIDPEKHGYNGPIHISDGGYRGESEMSFLDTIKKMGHKEIVDLQDFDQVGGFSRWQRYVCPEGKRQDSAHCYIHPLLRDGAHPNLHILVESKVTRVIFDESTPPRAVGVEYIPTASDQPLVTLSNPVQSIVKAKKMVVVSAGALGTPQILERSGVGNPDLLKRLGIEVKADVKGVGKNYQDHQLVVYPYKTSLGGGETLDGIISGRRNLVEALEEKDPIVGWNGVDLCSKLRMTPAEVASLGPAFQADWDRDFAPFPTRPDMLCGVVNAFLGDPSLIEAGQYMTMGVYTAYPYSRGSIHINSPTDVLTGYEFDTGFLTHPSDIKKQLWAYKTSREIARRLPHYRGELALGHPNFGDASKAKLHEGPLLGDGVTDIEYDDDDDRAIEEWIRMNLNTTWHSLGTCAMRAKVDGGVVSPDLDVWDTEGLKIVDLSIAPENVGANTNNTALATGEKAALIIGKELGIVV